MTRHKTLLALGLAATACADVPATEVDVETPWTPDVGALSPISTACEYSPATTSQVFRVTLKDGESALLAVASDVTLTVNGKSCLTTPVLLAKFKRIGVTVASGEPTASGVRVLVDQSGGPFVKGSTYTRDLRKPRPLRSLWSGALRRPNPDFHRAGLRLRPMRLRCGYCA